MRRERQTNADYVPEPVQAYERISASYPEIAGRRRKYLDSVDRLIVERISGKAGSLLDVGAGDGERALRIAASAGIEEVVLLEPSAGMRSRMKAGPEIWPICLEQLDCKQVPFAGRCFDAITCLWNVMGHLGRAKARTNALAQLRKLLAPGGLLFLDVNHRYNTSSYGFTRTAGRFVWDIVWPCEHHGNVVVNWEYGSPRQRCSTYGHVFTGREVQRLARAAGFSIEERIVVDYDEGCKRRFAFQGNLLYCLRRENPAVNPAKDAASAAQTSSISASVI